MPVAPEAALPLYAMLPFALMLLAIAVFPLWLSTLVGAQPEQAAGGRPAGPAHPRTLSPAGARRSPDRGRGVRLVHHPSGGPLRDLGRRSTPRRPGRHAAHQYRFPGDRLADGLVRRTTGASMLLIRALLQTNKERTRVSHTVVFFIFTVSNIGGMLTPFGDPPLFLGLSPGRPVRLDLSVVAALALDDRGRAPRLLCLGHGTIRARAGRGASP